MMSHGGFLGVACLLFLSFSTRCLALDSFPAYRMAQFTEETEERGSTVATAAYAALPLASITEDDLVAANISSPISRRIVVVDVESDSLTRAVEVLESVTPGGVVFLLPEQAAKVGIAAGVLIIEPFILTASCLSISAVSRAPGGMVPGRERAAIKALYLSCRLFHQIKGNSGYVDVARSADRGGKSAFALLCVRNTKLDILSFVNRAGISRRSASREALASRCLTSNSKSLRLPSRVTPPSLSARLLSLLPTMLCSLLPAWLPLGHTAPPPLQLC